MHRPTLAQGGNDLAQSDAAVVGRDALVPIGAEAFLDQALDGALSQVTILKAAPGKDHSFLPDSAGINGMSYQQKVRWCQAGGMW